MPRGVYERTPAHRAKRLGRVCSAETRAKISAATMGRVVSAATRAKIGAVSKGHVASAATLAKMRAAAVAHGMHDTPTYTTWEGMIQRCGNPNYNRFAGWGGRGITVCERWRNFANFYADMGDRPEGMTIDRIANDGNYEPGNCRWATRSEQQRNRGGAVQAGGRGR